MCARDDAAGESILVIGYGNTLRGDDAVGQRVALAVSNWQIPGLTSLATHQLTAELAEPLSRADLAIFVDAQVAPERNAVEIHPLEPSNRADVAGHTSTPQGLLALALAVYGCHAKCWLVSVPGADFSLREGLSPTSATGVAEALTKIAALIEARAASG